MKTNKLSTDRESSIKYPVKKSFASPRPNCHRMKALNNSASEIHTLLQTRVSLRLGACVRRFTMTRSTNSAVSTVAKNKIHTQIGYSGEFISNKTKSTSESLRNEVRDPFQAELILGAKVIDLTAIHVKNGNDFVLWSKNGNY